MTRAKSRVRNCDVFIVGSGLIGSTFARYLHARGADVVMADIGDHHSRRAGENRKNSWLHQRDLVRYGHFVRSQLHPVMDSGAGDYPAAQVSYAVGGMAAHWTCAVPEFHEQLERPDFIDPAEWRRLYGQAGALLNIHNDVFAASRRQQAILRALANAGIAAVPTPMAAERSPGSPFPDYTGADTVLGELAEPTERNRFTIVTEQCVTRLVRAGDRITCAEVVDLHSGDVRTVYADTFVVGAGWLHTAQLLWASGIHSHEENALGRYFCDHTFGACTVALDPAHLATVGIAAVDGEDPPPHLYLPVAEDRPWQGMIFRESYQFDPDPRTGHDPLGIDLKWFGMIEPNRENRVTFSDSHSDRFGLPSATFRLRLSARDHAVRARMMDDMANVARTLGAYKPGGEPTLLPLGAAIHATGLTRMGARDDGASVVDPWSRVWGLDNLYLGGTSVIPTPSAANPTFTAVALAVRAATALCAAAERKARKP